MPKRKPSRSQRRRGARQAAPPRVAAAPVRPVSQPVAVAQPGRAPEAAAPRESSVTRFSARDYSYVRRDIRSILVLAAVILITIVVLSFFLP